jgi:hypothetical protein
MVRGKMATQTARRGRQVIEYDQGPSGAMPVAARAT